MHGQGQGEGPGARGRAGDRPGEAELISTFSTEEGRWRQVPSLGQGDGMVQTYLRRTGVKCQVSIVRSQVSVVKCQVSSDRCQVSCVRYKVSGIKCQVASVWCQVASVHIVP